MKDSSNISWNRARNMFSEGTQRIFRLANVSTTKPPIITIDATDRCQLRCHTCTKWKTPETVQSKELTTEDWKKVLFELKRWLGEFYFIFSGGEPLLRRDIFEISSFAESLNIHSRLITNGCGFDSLARNTVESSLEAVIVSLNGKNAETHDSICGVDGAFNKTIRFIREINNGRKAYRKKALGLTINTLLLPVNYQEVSELVRWVQEEGLDGISFQAMDPIGGYHSVPVEGIDMDPSLRGAGDEWYRQNLKNAHLNLRDTINELVSLKKNGYQITNSIENLRRIEAYYRDPFSVSNNCQLGFSSFNIDPYGYVRFCFNLKPIGNVKYSSPRSLFNNKEARKIRIQIKNCRQNCHWVTK